MNYYKQLFASTVIFAQILLVGAFGTLAVAHAEEVASNPPVLTTDKADYLPGETATIYGKFFGALQEAVLKVFGYDENGGNYTENTQNVTADSDGNFIATYLLENVYRPLYTVVASTLGGTKLAEVTFTDAPASTNLEQCRNGGASSPNNCVSLGGGSGWVTGNVGASQGHLTEGLSIPYRAVMTNLPTGVPVTIIFGYDIKHSNKHAVDYLTHYNRLSPHTVFGHSAEIVDPTSGVSGISGTTTTFPIPVPDSTGSPVAGQPAASFNALPASERVMTLFGGTITGMAYVSQGDLTASNSETRVSITFTASSATAVFAWGGHIADRDDWGFVGGVPRSAGGISGSPYHMRTIDWTLNNLGNQDRSLSAGTIISPSTIVIHKVTQPNISDPTVFTFNTTGTGYNGFTLSGGGQDSQSVNPGTYSVTEIVPSGWENTNLTCTASGTGSSATPTLGSHSVAVTIGSAGGATIDCIYTNTLQQAHLTLVKTVMNDNGGTAVPTDWTLAASGATPISGTTGAPAITNAAVNSGTYTLSETGGPSGYTASAWNCTGTTVTGGNSITLVAGNNATCTINNDDIQPKLTVTKIVANNHGGNAVVSDFPLFVGATAVTSGVQNGLNVGNYTVSETNLSGYTPGVWGGNCASDGSVTLGAGDVKTCTITNTDQPAYITLIKNVDKNYGGTAGVDDFGLTVGGSSVLSGSVTDVNSNTPIALNEVGLTGYSFVSITGDAKCPSVLGGTATLDEGEHLTCTITNEDLPGHLIVHKITNPSDTTTAFSITATGGVIVSPSATQPIVGGSSVDYTVYAGTYSVDEAVLSGWDETGNDCVNVVVANGETKECTITNVKRGRIIIKKNAVPDSNTQAFTFNNNFGNGNPATFSLTDTTDTGLPSYDAEVIPGTYVVTEDSVSGWKLDGATCDAGETVDSIDVAPGETVTCTFTNKKLATIILVKNTVGGDDIFAFTMTGTGLPSSDTIATAGNTGSNTYENLDPDLTYTVDETPIPAGWAKTGAACNNGDPVTAITPNAGEIITCTFTNNKPGAQIDIDPLSAVNEIGDDHVFTATVKVHNGNGTYVNASDGTLVTFSLSNNTASAVFPGGNTCTTTAGACSITVSSTQTGGVDISASSDPVELGIPVHVETDGAGDNSVAARKDWVDAYITIGETATNNITEPHTFTITLTQVSGSATPAASANITPNVTPAPDSISDTCGTVSFVGNTATCTVTINNNTPGIFTATASASLTIDGVTLNRSTNGTLPNSGSAIKTYVAGALEVTKILQLNNYLLPNDVDLNFSIEVSGPSYPVATVLTFTVVDGIVSGSQMLNNLIPGVYTVNEVGADTAAWTVTGGGNVTVNPGTPSAQSSVTNSLKIPSTGITLTPNTFETTPDENVILTITDTNDGQAPISSPSVELFGNSILTVPQPTYVSGDTNTNGVMDVGETWAWTWQGIISVNTVFTVNGIGIDPLGNPVNGPTYISETASQTVKVIGTTRTLGYWQTHTSFTTSVFTNQMGSTMLIGDGATHKGPVETVEKVFGGFYAPMAKTSTGGKRTQIDQARITLLQQLLAAKLNCAAFGCSAAVQGQITAADTAYASTNKNAIMSSVSVLDTFNNSGDANAIPSTLPPTGKATPALSKSLANPSFWDNP